MPPAPRSRPATLAAEVRGAAVYLSALRGFLRTPLSPAETVERIREQRARRADAFLDVLRRGVFGSAASAYRPLFDEAGIEFGDAAGLVGEHGVEGALERLYDAGVRVSVDELRGRTPLRRGSREFAPGSQGFANPFASQHYEARSGGSRSDRARIPVSLDLLAHESCYVAVGLRAFGLDHRPTAAYLPAPPGVAGLKQVLAHAKLGRRVERWFSQTDPGWRGGSLRYAAFTRATVAVAGRVRPGAVPAPEHTPPADAERVALWAADAKRRGVPGAVFTTSSSAVRVCRAAGELGVDISGTFLRASGEPYTRGRAELVAAAGCHGIPAYYVSDLGGLVGMACAAPETLDDVHVPADKLAVIQRPRRVGAATVGVLVFTALHAHAPRVTINLETDDFGVLRRRACGCPVEESFGDVHVHGIRSYQKLTSDGMNFLGEDVVELVEQVLPSRFGGRSTDFQLVEHEEDGLARVGVVVSPALGPVDEAAVVEAVGAFLRERGQALTAEIWSSAGTLRVVRREPYVTAAGKLPVVHALGTAPPD